MLTVRGLVSEMGLELTTGDAGADAPVRWVHISELPDPTPWLSGGELLLTTGIQLDTDERQREFVRLLAGHHLAGLGFGTGFDHDNVPAGARRRRRSELGFPVFEVPYELPFIALTEKAFTRLVNEQYEVLQRGIAIHKRLERLVLEESGLDEVVRALAAATGGAVCVLSGPRRDDLVEGVPARAAGGRARAGARRRSSGAARSSAAAPRGRRTTPSSRPTTRTSPAARSCCRSRCAAAGRRRRGSWRRATPAGLGDFERLILQQAVTVVALELMRQRAMRDTERRLAGDVLAEALTGRLSEEELAMRLRPFGIGHSAAVLVFGGHDGAPAPHSRGRARPLPGRRGHRRARGHARAAAVRRGRRARGRRPGRARRACAGRDHGATAPGCGPPRRARRPWARCGAPSTRRAARSRRRRSPTARRPPVASYRDLGAFQLLLSLQDDDALRLYCDSVLGPLEDASGEYGDELIRSLEAFIEQNGQWEQAARELYCHRHTLRYRIRRVEQLTGRDLSSARDRIEFWLALRARGSW